MKLWCKSCQTERYFDVSARCESCRQLPAYDHEKFGHRQDCSLQYESAEVCAAKGLGCTCEREARMQDRREAGDPVWQ